MQLDAVQRLLGQVLEQLLEGWRGLQLAQAQVQVQVPLWGPRWPRRNRQQRWRASSWHRASTVRSCRFSKRVLRCRCASCQSFVRQRLLRELQMLSTSPLY